MTEEPPSTVIISTTSSPRKRDTLRVRDPTKQPSNATPAGNDREAGLPRPPELKRPRIEWSARAGGMLASERAMSVTATIRVCE
jgi:hypothetical protein